MRISHGFLLVCAIFTPRCFAYGPYAHDRITANAVIASELAQPVQAIGISNVDAVLPTFTFRTAFGIFSSPFHIPFSWDPTTTPRCLGQRDPGRMSIGSIFRLGAYCEDSTDISLSKLVPRYANHFFDPVHGGAGIPEGRSSLEWGTMRNGGQFGQYFSYSDFKSYLSDGITSRTVALRQGNIANAFRALGQVIHLVEDLAQPQHTRADKHGIPSSLYERYTDEVYETLPMLGYSPIALGGMSIVDIWHTVDGRGLADYSNRGFVTKGTNFSGPAGGIRANIGYDLPNGDGAALQTLRVQDLAQGAECPGKAIPRSVLGDITFVGTPVVDKVANSTDINPRTSTYSIFDEDLQSHGFSQTFTLNRFNFCEAHKFLIPRAVGYAAALINYAFRGSLKVALLDEGVAAVTNAGDLECKLPCGFGLVKTKVSNAAQSEERVGMGRLVAVARYHRNVCFHPDLSGQPGGSEYLGASCRGPTSLEPLNEYVAVSNEIMVDGFVGIEPRVVAFDFSENPIPLDATDLYLQVLFRGQLGDETDGIALGSIDLTEPTFLTFSNDYDYINVYGEKGEYVRSQPTSELKRHRIERLALRHNNLGRNSSVLASLDLLSPGLYSRIAILTDMRAFDYQIDYRYGGADSEDVNVQEFEVETAIVQLNESNMWAHFPDYVTLRHYRYDGWLYQPMNAGASIYWVEPPICEATFPDCVPVDVTVGDQVRRFPQFVQYGAVPMKINFNE